MWGLWWTQSLQRSQPFFIMTKVILFFPQCSTSIMRAPALSTKLANLSVCPSSALSLTATHTFKMIMMIKKKSQPKIMKKKTYKQNVCVWSYHLNTLWLPCCQRGINEKVMHFSVVSSPKRQGAAWGLILAMSVISSDQILMAFNTIGEERLYNFLINRICSFSEYPECMNPCVFPSTLRLYKASWLPADWLDQWLA